MSTPVRSGYYGVAVGVGVPVTQAKVDSTRFPGRVVDAPVSVQVPLVVTRNCRTPFGLILDGPTVNVPQLKCAVGSPGVVVPVWLLAKCQMPNAGPIAREAFGYLAGVQVRRTRPSHQLMMRY
jgi:hypothetical protein